MNLNPFYWLAEWRLLRRCATVKEFSHYVTTKLKNPENIAWWIQQNIWFQDEVVGGWYSIEDALRTKMGNCTEMACLGVFALRLIGYEAHVLCVFGLDEQNNHKGHAVAAFEHKGKRGWIGSVVRCYSDLPWQTLVPMVRKDWKITERYKFTNEKGETIKGFGA